jgi:hypothetical protein
MTIIIILQVIIGVALVYIIARLFVANQREERMLAEKTRRQIRLTSTPRMTASPCCATSNTAAPPT